MGDHSRFARICARRSNLIKALMDAADKAVRPRAVKRAPSDEISAAKNAEGRLGSPGRPRHDAYAPELGRRLKEHPKGEAAALRGEARTHAMDRSVAITEETPRRRLDHPRDGPLRRFYGSSVFRHRNSTSLQTKRKTHAGPANGEMPPSRGPGGYRPPVHESKPASTPPRQALQASFQDPETTKAASGIPGGLHALTALRWAAYESASGLAISRLLPGTDA